MATYLMLFRFTEQGISMVKESPARVESAKQLVQQLGGVVKQFYTVMGRYDTVFILEAPDDETAAKIALAIGSQGKVQTETLRAFTENEFKQIILGLP